MRFRDLVAQLDARPKVRGDQFELLCRWYLENAPEYRAKVKHVWLWREWPGRWGIDAGIDLVAETHGGDTWAIQAKAYEPSYSIKKSDVDKFLSESSRPQFSYRLLIATTDGLGDNAYRTLVHQEKPVGLALRSHLEASAVAWPTSIDALLPVRSHPKTPRPHQLEAIEAVRKGFEQADRGQLIMACGTGKTLVAWWVCEALASERTLVLVPSLTLLSQTLREWTANAVEPIDYLAVCSDQTVAEHDAMVSWTADLGLPVTTDPDAIERFLRGGGCKVIFATYQSSPRLAETLARDIPAFDLVIADEAHRCTGPTTSEFTTVLDASKIRAARRLFMTATPRYFSGRVRKEAREADFEIASMDDESVFGKVFHQLSFSEAIARDLLSDYRVLVIGVDDEACRQYADEGQLVTFDGSRITDARTLASHIGLAKAMRKYDLRRTVSFHGRISKAHAFSAAFPAVVALIDVDERPTGKVWSSYISGEMPSSKRDGLLQQFRSLEEYARGLLSNARCLAEGVDVPAIDGVAFIDPRSSTIDIIQAVGRAIRKAESKALGTVVLPVFVNSQEQPEELLNGSSFRSVWHVIRALRAHDNLLADELDSLRRGLGRQRIAASMRPSKIVLDIPVTVGREFFNAFDAHLIQSTTESWEFWFGLLENFVAREGHARVPQTHVEDGFRVGIWVAAQRKSYRRGDIDGNRAGRLEALPGWTWNPFDTKWEDGFATLLRFVAREGHARVPQTHVEDGTKLGDWVSTQRRMHRAKKLSDGFTRRLEALPGWIWHVNSTAWESSFEMLAAFAAREGHANVPASHIENGNPIGQWVARQRQAYARGALDGTRVRRLNALDGWSWDVLDVKWEDAFALLLRFVERESNARVPQSHIEGGFRLGSWVTTQRSSFAGGTLDDARRRRLEELAGWTWNALDARWQEGLASLRRFAEREGHAQVPHAHVEERFRLGLWVGYQRRAYARGALCDARIRQLQASPRWTWGVADSNWERAFIHLVRFVEREDDARVPATHVEDGFKLGVWVNKQRKSYRRGEIQHDRARRLEALPGWTWTPFDMKWKDAFAILLRFVAREGHTQVPQAHMEGDFRLGDWVARQRRAEARGTLDRTRIHRLEDLPGWAWRGGRLSKHQSKAP